MACCTAACAAFASAMVSSLTCRAASRSAVAFATAASTSLTWRASSLRSCVSCEISALWSSISVVSWLTSSFLCLRVTAFRPSSASQKPLFSVSAVISSISCEIKSLIIFFTFLKGSCAARCEAWASSSLPLLLARSARSAATCACRGLRWMFDTCARAPPLAACSCSSMGRCFCPVPLTALLLMISMACSSVFSSSDLSFSRILKSSRFLTHMFRVSRR
mmetsp:Transcript_90673/g.293521  ORF Transcript_90673/g.293521 Transcript_90673/m.293521 type:complete len:220 (-) Transcript_90673:986-1645(-)